MFLAGLFVGFLAGYFLLALVTAAGRADEQAEREQRRAG